MPTKTKRDEQKWEKAKDLAADAGKKDNYAYIMGIYKNMKPDYEFKTAAEIVASRFMRAYEEGHKLPMGQGYEPGRVAPQSQYKDQGSQMPPARDRDGLPIEIAEFEREDIPGYTYEDKGKEFHSNPPGDATVPRVASNESISDKADPLRQHFVNVLARVPGVTRAHLDDWRVDWDTDSTTRFDATVFVWVDPTEAGKMTARLGKALRIFKQKFNADQPHEIGFIELVSPRKDFRAPAGPKDDGSWMGDSLADQRRQDLREFYRKTPYRIEVDYTYWAPGQDARRASLKQAAKWAGIDISSKADRDLKWWSDLSALLKEYFSLQNIKLKGFPGHIEFQVKQFGDWNVRIDGSNDAPIVFMENDIGLARPQTFRFKEGDSLWDILMWIDAVTRSQSR